MQQILTDMSLGRVDNSDVVSNVLSWAIGSPTPTISKREVGKKVCSVPLMIFRFQLFWAWGPLLATNFFLGMKNAVSCLGFQMIMNWENIIHYCKLNEPKWFEWQFRFWLLTTFYIEHWIPLQLDKILWLVLGFWISGPFGHAGCEIWGD